VAQPRYYTTQQIAKMLGVSVPTVVNWVKQARLEAHKTPGGHRRISQEALEAFASTYAYPLPTGNGPPQVATTKRILVIDHERDFGEMVGEYLQLKGAFQVKIASHAFEAGFYLGSFRPHLVLLDLELNEMSGLDLAQLVAEHGEGQPVRILGSTTFLDTVPRERLEAAGFSEVIAKPIKLDELLARIQAELG